jgi:peptidoglycan/LPS O-acetylase OafA/YrhL
MFVVLALFELFLAIGKPMSVVPVLFLSVLLLSGVFGELIARFYSEPLNRLLRENWGDGPNKLGSVIGPADGKLKDQIAEASLS